MVGLIEAGHLSETFPPHLQRFNKFQRGFFKPAIDACGLDREELSYHCGLLAEAST